MNNKFRKHNVNLVHYLVFGKIVYILLINFKEMNKFGTIEKLLTINNARIKM